VALVPARFPFDTRPRLDAAAAGWQHLAPAARSLRARAAGPARSAWGTPTSVSSSRSQLSVLSHRSVASVASAWSLLSAGSLLSIGSVGSILSIGSSGSILSIGSSGSILSIGASGGFLQLGSDAPTARGERRSERRHLRAVTG
jgi:hypothetical protein